MIRCTHSWTDATATIGVAGIERPLRVLHVTDSHISVAAEEVDRPYAHYGARMDGLVRRLPHPGVVRGADAARRARPA